MKSICLSIALAGCLLAALSSCAAGRVDRVEDRYDRTEDRLDRRVDTGPADVREDHWDRRENVHDKRRGRIGL